METAMADGREGSPPALNRRAVSVPLAPGVRGSRVGVLPQTTELQHEKMNLRYWTWLIISR
ncbi:hypothetical protein RRF57_002739 [Xylaria bambusicola]|uniref:Uncharacterized protein n=1 Tax=Xylaria bambusicola TaxID=326684 RepID=A0AAN7UDK4_9PEZI